MLTLTCFVVEIKYGAPRCTNSRKQCDWGFVHQNDIGRNVQQVESRKERCCVHTCFEFVYTFPEKSRRADNAYEENIQCNVDVTTGGMRKNDYNIFQESSLFLTADMRCGDWVGNISLGRLCSYARMEW